MFLSFSKLFVSIFILLGLKPSYGKFAATVRFIPCEQFELKVKSCQQKTFESSDYRRGSRSRKVPGLSYSGALVSAQVLSQKMVQCYKGHKIDPKMYRKTKVRSEEAPFFIKDGKCSQKSTIIATQVNTFCDTPGAVEIPDCFINALSYQEKLIFLKLSKE